MNWEAFWNDLFIGATCGAVGFIAGNLRQVRRQARESAARLGKVERDVDDIKRDQDEHGYLSSNRRFAAIVVIVALTALASGVTVKRQQDQSDANKARSICTQQLFAEAIGAIKADRLFAIQQAQASLQAAQARSTYLSTFTQPMTDKERARAFEAYLSAENFYITATQGQIKVAQDNPLPTAAEIDACK